MATGRPETGRGRPRPLGVPVLAPVPGGWWFDGLLVAAFAALTAALVWWSPLLRLDLAVRDWCDAHRPSPVHVLMQAFDYLGQGGGLIVVTMLVAGWLAWQHRTARPIVLAGLAPIISTLLIVGLKRWTSRGAPHHGSVRLFTHGPEVEYPSGHVSNAIVYYVVLAVLLAPYLAVPARRIVQWLPGVLTFIGTTYVSYHWLTDSMGGYLLGLLIARLLLRVPWRTVPLPRWLDRASAC
ncbi:PAP2 superfamily protein [Micromonospora viridifaciens]|uniref:PAP2 superfamily protein n=1 Tax=Micromonospora viridifaciens TaxID=1881 RepID=A0A1C4XHH0_MICVI|nr:phosphatase PAP2 family protein [Micromonospora viridifaciens]SCF07913.1 PAP2 superfamily protein [Micromonospora viridifaciens]